MSAEEKIDILDPAGKFLGFAKDRSEVHAKGLWHRTVHIWVFDGERILFQERSREKPNFPGFLDTSCAGHISAGETSRVSGCRELKEELGLQRSPGELTYLFESGQQLSLCNGTYLDNEYYDAYRTDIGKEEISLLKPQPHEVESFRWFMREELREELAAHPEKFVPHPDDFRYLLGKQ